MTPVNLRALSRKQRRAWLNSATTEEIEAATVPRTGEAHANEYAESCAVCMGIAWGRMLPPEPER